MPASSEAQRRLFGMVLAYKRGKLKTASPVVKKVSAGVSESSASDFASEVKKKRERLARSMAT